MIGFRIYPVAPYMKILNSRTYIDSRMGYDIDILVHYSWKNVPVISYPVKIHYPEDGISTFRLFRDNGHIALTYTRLCLGYVRDNIRISGTYARLCLGMFVRFPVLLVRKIKKGKK